MKCLIVLVVLLVNLSCGRMRKTVGESSVQSKDIQKLDSLKIKVSSVDEWVSCNDTLGISLRPEYSIYPIDTKFIRFVLCNNSGQEIKFIVDSRITYQDEKGIWRKLPLPANISVADMLYIMQHGESRFVYGSLHSDVQPNGTGRYRYFHNLTCNGKHVTLMAEFQLTNNKQKLKNVVRNVPFFSSLDPVNQSNKINAEEKQDSIFKIAEVMPEFPGGMDKLFIFIQNNIQYPQQALKNGVQGRVYVQVVINKDGSITDCRILESVDPYLSKEAIRIARSMPNWKPGRQNGKVVRVQYTFPVMFKLVGN